MVDEVTVRVMRLLSAHGICDESGVGSYRLNTVGELLNTPGQIGATRSMSVKTHSCAQVFHKI